MKSFIIMTLATLISITSFAKAELIMVCVDKLNEKAILNIYTGKAGEGGDGVSMSFDTSSVNKKDTYVNKTYDLQWHSSGGAGLGKNVSTLDYSNQSYGKKAHDKNNILQSLQIVMTYGKSMNDSPKKVEATLVSAVTTKYEGGKEQGIALVASNYTCVLKNQE